MKVWSTYLKLIAVAFLLAGGSACIGLRQHNRAVSPAVVSRGSVEHEEMDNPTLVRRPLVQPRVQSPLPASFPVTTRFGQWSNIGPDNYGGKVWDLAVSPTTPDVVFAAYGDGGGLWKSTNGGTSWQQVGDPSRNTAITSVSICSANPNVVIAGLGSPSAANINLDTGLLKSTDGGATWQAIGPVVDAKYSFVDVKCSIDNSNVYYAADEQALYKTTDGGANWQKLIEYDGPNWYDGLPSIALHPTDPNTMLLWAKGIDVQRSSDGGNSWANVGPQMDHSHPAVFAWSKSNPSIVYCEREGPQFPSMLTYRSNDAGRNWTPGVVMPEFEQGRYDQSIAVDPLNPNRVLTANTSMAESLDGLQSYKLIAAGHGDYLKIVFAPSNPQIVYNGNDGGVWKSTRAGVSGSWVRADVGVSTNKSFGFGIDPQSGKIYLSAGDYAGIVYQPGKGWTDLGGGEEWAYFYVNPHDPTDVYESGAFGIYRVGAPNTKWPNIGPDLAGHRGYNNRIVFHPTDPNTIYTATSNGLWQSTDRGNHWSSLGPSSDAQPFVGGNNGAHDVVYFDVAPSDPSTIYAAFLGNQGTLWRTVDAGKTWTPLRNPAYADYQLTSFAIDPSNAQRIYFSNNFGVYMSDDGGKTVRSIANNLPSAPSSLIMVAPDNPSRLFLLTVPGVMLSEDGGASWSLLGSNLPRGIKNYMMIVNKQLFVGTSQSIWALNFPRCTFSVSGGASNLGPSASTGTINVSADSGCAWTATSPVSWITITNGATSAGSGSVNYSVLANTGAQRSATLTIAGQSFTITQAAADGNGGSGGQGPAVTAGGIANAASFAPSVAPGSLFSIFGTNFASASVSASALPLPTTLSGVQVLVNGHAIPLVFVGAGQINAQMPFDVPPGPATLAVSVNGTVSTASPFTVEAAAPGIFQFGTNRAIVVNQDGRLNNTDAPAAVGSAIVAYTTGGGAVSTAVAAGTASPTDPLARLTANVTATIGGQPATVYFAGLTPGFVGLVQVNLGVPDLPTGVYPMVITVGGKPSNAPVINVVKQ